MPIQKCLVKAIGIGAVGLEIDVLRGAHDLMRSQRQTADQCRFQGAACECDERFSNLIDQSGHVGRCVTCCGGTRRRRRTARG